MVSMSKTLSLCERERGEDVLCGWNYGSISTAEEKETFGRICTAEILCLDSGTISTADGNVTVEEISLHEKWGRLIGMLLFVSSSVCGMTHRISSFW